MKRFVEGLKSFISFMEPLVLLVGITVGICMSFEFWEQEQAIEENSTTVTTTASVNENSTTVTTTASVNENSTDVTTTVPSKESKATLTATIVNKNVSSKFNTGTYFMFGIPSSSEVYYIELEVENNRDVVEVSKNQYLKYNIGDTVTLYQSQYNEELYKSKDEALRIYL